MGVLKIPQIPQYGVLVEETYGKDDSLFHDVYKGAAKNVADIITGLSENKNEYFSNPCIAFVGKRGTGKSSAMISFANFLHKITPKTSQWIDDPEVESKLNNSYFYVLPPIDTANMGKKETIIADVSAEMYSQFESLKSDITVEQKREFIEAAKKTNSSAILQCFGEWDELGDQLLAETEKVVHIRKLFEKMVQSFLNIVKKEKENRQSYLVIQIDDLDMNVSNSFRIMEEIRTIMSTKNVIVLLSVDLRQLKTVLKIHFENSLTSKDIFDYHTITKIAKDLSYKYTEKLLPADRRHYMPELTTEQLGALISSNFLGDNDESWETMGWSDEYQPSVIHAFMHLLWRKTMLIPMKNEYGDYILLPHNLRSLCNFVVFLRGMKDAAYPPNAFKNQNTKPLTYFDFANPKKGAIYRKILENNLRLFNKYIISNLETCERPEMNEEDEKLTSILLVLIETLSDIYITEFNSKIVGDLVRAINGMSSDYYLSWLNSNMGTKPLLEATRYKDTISVGDVMYVLGKLDKKTHCSYIRYLIQVIRTLWSVRMTMEIYVIGCNPINQVYCESESIFITKSFRDTVGAMFINPDITESFVFNEKNFQNDWSICEWKKFQSPYDLIIPKGDNTISLLDKNYTINQWRVHSLNGKTVYRNHYEKGINMCVSHPMALFSNLLYSNFFENGLSEEKKVFSAWQNEYVMIFPLYSMDYMFRLYEEYIRQIRTFPYSKAESVMSYVLKHIKKAAYMLCDEIHDYIPYIYHPRDNVSNNLSEDNKLTNEQINKNPDYLFQAPIESLIELINWDNELVPINIDLIYKLEALLSKMENIDIFSDNFDTSFFPKVWSSVSQGLPQMVIESEEFNIKPYNNYTECIDKLRKLLSAVQGKGDFVPFYYYADSVRIPRLKGKNETSSKKAKN